MNPVTSESLRGYIEGYYGQLLSWPERSRVLATLADSGFNTYFYAPKEDALHRLNWRDAYSEAWRMEFSRFCALAKSLEIHVLAGVAPGLDFDFAQIDNGVDFSLLVEKSRQLLIDGAAEIVLSMDDIDEDFHLRSGAFDNEGGAHAELANRLALALGREVMVVPRVYSNDIALSSPAYPGQFAAVIDSRHPVLLCGTAIVAQSIQEEDFQLYSSGMSNRIVVWDNLYANDYCPRRLFVGPWTGRDNATEILLNPTGMIETDLLLLSVMAVNGPDCHHALDKELAWNAVISGAGVPDQFLQVSQFFCRPPFTGDTPLEFVDRHILTAALDFLLWKWKTPLSREWYPYFMALQQDLLLNDGELSEKRIRKIYSPPMATRLLAANT